VTRSRALLAASLAAVCVLALPGPAEARKSLKKSIWGPVRVAGVSQFPVYRDLGAGIYQIRMGWDNVAARPPAHPRDPADPAYDWPESIDFALSEGQRYGIRVFVLILGAPRWANGDQPFNHPPREADDFADFAEAASKRYPGVRGWMIWGEPTRRENFAAVRRVKFGAPVSEAQREGPRRYAEILDESYGRLKGIDAGDLVIGGNSFTTGDVPPRSWVKLLRLPNGRPPRMDLYGHNPFTLRRPVLSQRANRFGWADFGTLDTLARAVTKNLGRKRLFLSEWTLPTDKPNYEFNFWVSRKVQARWLATALKVTRRWKRIYSLGWLELYDEPPNKDNNEVHRGLLDHTGKKKPSYRAYKRG
jgi:hypothetical protein